MTRRELLCAFGGIVPLQIARLGVRREPASQSTIRGPQSAIVFDAYGTLFDVHSVVALANKLFPGRGDALSQRWRAKQLEYSWTLALTGRYEDFWNVTDHALTFSCHALHLPCSTSQHDRLMSSYLHLSTFSDAAAGLKQVSGRTLAILSNGSPKMLTSVVSSAGLDGTFKQVISVDEIHVYKPSARVYKLASDKLGVEPASVLFVSSNAWDVAGAKAFGFRTCWVNRDDAPHEELNLNADVVVKSVMELPRAL